MNKKYELSQERATVLGHTLYRIKALRNFSNIKTGSIGGFIESESNLSHIGKCWVSGNAKVYGNAWVYGAARVFGNAKVFENAQVYENTWIYQYAQIFGNAEISGETEIFGYVQVYGDAYVCGDAYVSGDHELNSGIWNREVQMNGRYYLVSTTLKKILLR